MVLTECLLVYLKPEDSISILRTLSTLFTGDLLFLNYEMIHPGDAFGKIMLENLEVRAHLMTVLLVGSRMQTTRDP